MAKRARNIGGEQTFLKHAFQHDSGTQTGYKQLKYDDTATVAADDSSPEYGAARNVSSPSLATVSATVANNSPTAGNPFASSGSSYSRINSSYRSGGTTGATAYHSIANLPMHSQSQTTMTGGGGGGGGGGHYAANISGLSAMSTNISGQKKAQFDLSRNPYQAQTSPVPMPNESQHQHQQQLLHSSQAPATASLSNHLTATCASWACNGIRELLASLALMCILSLLTAFLALFFLQRSSPMSSSLMNDEMIITPSHNSSSKQPQQWQTGVRSATINVPLNHRLVGNVKEYMRVFQISVCLSTLTIALDLCCLFVCCIQFLSIVKLIKTPYGRRRSFEFVKKTSHIRVLAIGAYLVSIPIFFTGVILYTFVNFDEIPALITSVIIGIGIIFCGIASVQNVYLWQWEKTKASQDMRMSQQAAICSANQQLSSSYGGSGPTVTATMQTYPHELSTLV